MPMGAYVVGDDIPSGRYTFTNVAGDGYTAGLYIYETDDLENRIDYGSVRGDGYVVTLKEGQLLIITWTAVNASIENMIPLNNTSTTIQTNDALNEETKNQESNTAEQSTVEPLPTTVPISEVTVDNQVIAEQQFTFMQSRWDLYIAVETANNHWKIEKWSRWNASTQDFKYDYEVAAFNISDPKYDFVWTDESQSAFFITLKDAKNSDLKHERIGFSINPNYDQNAAQYTFTSDRWAQYRTYALSPSVIKIECWGRWNASTDEFEHYYDIGVINTSDSSSDFSWIDDTHSAFFITMEDDQNDNWKNDAVKIGFSVDPASVTETASYTFTNDRWAQYRAYALSPSIIKVECWGRWNASTDEFEHYYDVGVINTSDSSSDFSWIDDTHSAFFITIFRRFM